MLDGLGVRAGARRAAGVCAVLLAGAGILIGMPARAQTLDEQYEYYLGGHCQNLNFARSGPRYQILPGQAGPNLLAFCNGPPPTAGPSESGSFGGGAGAAEGRGEGAEEDAALKRRRDKLRQQQAETPTADGDVDLGRLGRVSTFLSLDYLHERQKSTEFEAGRRSDGVNGTLGADYRFGGRGVAGLALKYYTQWGDIDTGGNFDMHGGGVWAYGSWWPRERLFVDFTVGFDFKGVHTERSVYRETTIELPAGDTTFFNPKPALAFSDTNSREQSAELRAGYDLSLGSVSVGPRMALTLRHSDLDPYLETGTTPMTLAFDEQTAISLRTQTGLQGTRAFTLGHVVLVPQLNADWVHEFRDDQRFITAHFAEDLRANPAILRFLNEPPDRDWFLARASTAAIFPHGVSGFATVESMFGHSYIDRYRASIGVRVQL